MSLTYSLLLCVGQSRAWKLRTLRLDISVVVIMHTQKKCQVSSSQTTQANRPLQGYGKHSATCCLRQAFVK